MREMESGSMTVNKDRDSEREMSGRTQCEDVSLRKEGDKRIDS